MPGGVHEADSVYGAVLVVRHLFCVQGHGDSVAISSHFPCGHPAGGLILSLGPIIPFKQSRGFSQVRSKQLISNSAS